MSSHAMDAKKVRRQEMYPPLSADEIDTAARLTTRAIMNGQQNQMFLIVGSLDPRAEAWMMEKTRIYQGYGGTMSESVKRPLDFSLLEDAESTSPSSAWNEVSLTSARAYHDGPSASVPMPTSSGALRMPETSVEDEDMSVELPADVHDVGTWGKTIVKMEAYADRNWRYRQIVEEAKSDKKVHGYLSWIVKTYGKEKSGPVKNQATDLARFLLRIRWTDSKASSLVGFERKM